MKFILAGFIGLFLGLVLGAVFGHICCIWTYYHATPYDQDEVWWGLADGEMIMTDGVLGGAMGLIAGLFLCWMRRRGKLKQSTMRHNDAHDTTNEDCWPPPPSPD